MTATPKKPITIACCVPKQEKTRQDKLEWLKRALDKTPCELFLTPQEFL